MVAYRQGVAAFASQVEEMTTQTINWITDWELAKNEARTQKKPILVDVYQDNCGGCERLANETFTDSTVVNAIASRFIPVTLHLQRDRGIVRDWNLLWTPTVYFADRSGKIRYESMNFVPADMMLDILDIGEAKVAMRWRELDKAIALLGDVEARHPDGPMTAEAIYWRGMAEYFGDGNNPDSSRRVWARIAEKFPNSEWAYRQP